MIKTQRHSGSESQTPAPTGSMSAAAAVTTCAAASTPVPAEPSPPSATNVPPHATVGIRGILLTWQQLELYRRATPKRRASSRRCR